MYWITTFPAAIKLPKIIKLDFNSIGSGLDAKGDRDGYLRGFAVAGAAGILSGKSGQRSVAVCCAWVDNPHDANLFNKEGLPATPDNWE